jgi:hypothetical protein
VHHFEHSQDDLLQEVCVFADDFIRDLVRKRQNALQPIENDRWNLVVFILFLQELDRQVLPSASDLMSQHRAQTSNVTLATPKMAFAIGFN